MKRAFRIIFLLLVAGGLGLSANGQTAEEFANRAITALNEKRIDDAIRDASAAIAKDAAFGPAYRTRGHAYLMRVEKEDRPAWTPPLEKRFPKSADAESAFADLNKAVELDPRDAFAYSYRGGLHYFINDLDAAAAEFKRAVELRPDHAWFRSMLDHVRKRHASQYSIAAGNKRNSLMGAADPARSDIVLREALVLHNKAIELNAGDASMYDSRAYTYEELGDFEKALADLDQMNKLAPNQPYLTNWRRAQLLSGLKRYSDAVAEYRKGLAMVEALNGDKELPLNDFRTHIAKNLALDGKYEEAFTMFDLALSIPRPSYITYYERGMAYLLKGDKDKAEADLRKSVELGRGYTPAADELRKMGKTP
jgi:tetratricopeptide (TPR) repeat protein